MKKRSSGDPRPGSSCRRGDAVRVRGARFELEERRDLQDRDELPHRLAEPVRRLQPGRVLHLHVHLSRSDPVRRAEREVRARLRPLVEDLEGRQDLDVHDGCQREMVGRQAADRRGRRVDDQHGHQVQGDRRRERRRSDRPHQAGGGAEPDDPRRSLLGGRRQRARAVPAIRDPPEAHLEQAHRPQGQRPEDVRELRARGRRQAPSSSSSSRRTRSRSSSATARSTAPSRRRTVSACGCSRTTMRSSPR